MGVNKQNSPLELRIGLTGGIGCGKSLALAEFERLGWSTIEADKLARAILNQDPEVHRLLLKEFGGEIFKSDGEIDRAALGKLVFSNKESLRFLESILHPRVRKEWQQLVFHPGRRFWIVEIPLLFEKNLEKDFDYTVCLNCSPHVQRRRLLGRGMSETDIQARISNQWPLPEKMSRADFVLTNDGSISFLHSQVYQLHNKLMKVDFSPSQS